MNGSHCTMWDEANQCCIWERLEVIFHYPWENVEVPEECFEEMP